jgi:hypothetical protein
MPGHPARRRLAALVAACAAAVLAVLALAACGGSTDPDPRVEALSYFPSNAPLVALVATDLKGPQYRSLERLIKRFPGGGQGLASLRATLDRELRVDTARDVEPLLGNPAVIGIPDAGALARGSFVATLVTRDAKRLQAIAKADRSSRSAGESHGARIYVDRSGRGAYAIRGPTVVLSGDERTLRDALARRDADDHLRREDIDNALNGLPRDAVLQVAADGQSLLSTPSVEPARRIRWLGALRRFGLAASVSDRGLDVRFKADTTRLELAAADLPLGAAGSPPTALPGLPIAIGIRDLGRLVSFVEDVGVAMGPSEFAMLSSGKTGLRIATGIDIDSDIVGQLTGDATVGTDLRNVVVRSELRDPKAMRETLARLRPLVPAFFEGAGMPGVQVADLGTGMYVLVRHRRPIGGYGVVKGALVAGYAPPDVLARVATARPAPGTARGSLVAKVPSEALTALIDRAVGGEGAARLILAPLGDSTLTVTATPAGLRGSFRVPVKG